MGTSYDVLRLTYVRRKVHSQKVITTSLTAVTVFLLSPSFLPTKTPTELFWLVAIRYFASLRFNSAVCHECEPVTRVTRVSLM